MKRIRAAAGLGALAGGLALAPVMGVAQDSGVMFKRVTAPPPGSRPVIDIQISPEEHAAMQALAVQEVAPDLPEAPDASGAPVVPPSTEWDWFWNDAANPAAGGAMALNRAMERMAAQDGVPAPRMQVLADIARTHGLDILRATIDTEVSPALVLAVIAVESAGRAEAVSSAGAQGLMQLIPATAARFGVEDATDPAQNITGGVAYLDWLLKHFKRDVIFTLAGYNAGEGAVREHGGVPPFAETRGYVPKVLAAWRVARGLCKTPPELITDGCVFSGAL
ncbi:MAG: lytic murein transglycosylase [Rhodobacterales bacterium]|nr:MAG: lytic murein transglycosylase [Rhodobacterales bacterium]